MSNECCQLVGDLDIGIGACVTSVSYNGSTEISMIGDCFIIGPTIGNVSIAGPASSTMYHGCPVRVGVQIPWIRKYDCDNNKIIFIPAGIGKSFIQGIPNSLVTASLQKAIRSYPVISADSSGGPTQLYTKADQTDGYGLNYSGTPISFSTTENGFTYPNIGIGDGPMYLQSFNVTYNPGSIPMANYSFVVCIDG